mmetsp:Transcript_36008/g.64451  ORF Transcript_36008/g.64451 Transcript_36008/m.64451 type:complete len:765 (-) Transcript_36008:1343-3637(-)
MRVQSQAPSHKSKTCGSESGEDAYDDDEFERYEEEFDNSFKHYKRNQQHGGAFEVADDTQLLMLQKRQPQKQKGFAEASPATFPTSMLMRPQGVATFPFSEEPLTRDHPPTGLLGNIGDANSKKLKKPKKKKDKTLGDVSPEELVGDDEIFGGVRQKRSVSKKKNRASLVHPVTSDYPISMQLEHAIPIDQNCLLADDEFDRVKKPSKRKSSKSRKSRAGDAVLRGSTDSTLSSLSVCAPRALSNDGLAHVAQRQSDDGRLPTPPRADLPAAAHPLTRNPRGSPTNFQHLQHFSSVQPPHHLPSQKHGRGNGPLDPFAKRPLPAPQPVLPFPAAVHNNVTPVSNGRPSSPMSMKPPTPPHRRNTPPQRLSTLQSNPKLRDLPPEVKPNRGNVPEVEDLCMSDCSDLDGELQDLPLGAVAGPQFGESSLTVGVGRGRHVRQLILGKNSSFSRAWEEQGFFPNPHISYGILQNEGGPCGVLAVVQAYILRFFLLTHESKTLDEALSRTLATILWHAANQSDDKQAYVCLPPAGSGLNSTKPNIENFRLFAFTDFELLLTFLESKLQVYQMPKGIGVILLVASAVLSRGGVDAVRGDMDMKDTSLIVEHGYCAQELVNLLLLGKATSNVFNGVQVLGGENGNASEEMRMHGIAHRGEIGFLTYYEHFDYFIVGSYLKDPVSPIWVICSESHYSVLFSKAPETLEDSVFDLYYYDELAKQEEEIRLTITIGAKHEKITEGDMAPPLEDTIRTKWPGASINWNGSDRIL